MRLRAHRIGAMNLFMRDMAGPAASADLDPWAVGQAFADVATIGILGERAAREHQLH